MVKKYISYLLFLILFVSVFDSFAQNLKSDMQKMNTALLSKTKWHIVTESSISTTSSTIKTINYDLNRLNDNYKVSDKNTEMIINSKYIIALNHIEKQIYVSERNGMFLNGTDAKEINKYLDLDFDTLMKFYQKIEFSKKSNSLSCYTIFFKNVEYEKMEVVFNSQTYLINEIKFWLKDKVSIENNKVQEQIIISKKYKLYDFNPKFDESFFAGKNVLLIDNYGKMKVSQKFYGYKLYNFNDNSYEK